MASDGTGLKEFCDCYKKLSLLGIPLFISEENAEYSEERRSDFFCEKAFQVPEFIRIDETIKEYPTVDEDELSVVFERMSHVVRGLGDYEVDVLSFWILDTIVEGLWTAQNAGMEHDHQKATLLWIAYFFNYVIKKNPSRKELFCHLKEILFPPEVENAHEGSNASLLGNSVRDSAEDGNGSVDVPGEKGNKEEDFWSVMTMKKKIWKLPLPPSLEEEPTHEEGVFESENSLSDFELNYESKSPTETSSINQSSVQSISEKNVLHMNIILEILYRIFGRLWVYMEFQSTVQNMPNAETVQLPFTLHLPKPLQNSEVPVQSKTGKKSIVPEKSPEEIEAEKQLHKNDFILPLQMSEEAKAYAMQFFGPLTGDKKGKGDKKK